MLVGVATSLSTQADVQHVPTRWLPAHPNVAAYRAFITGKTVPGSSSGGTASDPGDFKHALFNSVTTTVLATAVILTVSVLAGYGFSRLPFRGSRTIMWAIVAALLLPVFTIVVTLFRIMANLHLIDTQVGLVLVFAATQGPLAMWLAYNQCRELPAEPVEAALIDGCNQWQAFVKVALPQMRSGIAAMGAIFMLAVWGEFLIPLLLATTLNTKPVTVNITELVGKYATNYPVLAAAGVIALIPPAIVALLLNRQIRGVISATN
ncbi:MAG: carbohydrate ABC transporter permease [Actinomycetota bacterium]|nr:carbohydrate ABC transporter permease [Actinomycetota bacterium]